MEGRVLALCNINKGKTTMSPFKDLPEFLGRLRNNCRSLLTVQILFVRAKKQQKLPPVPTHAHALVMSKLVRSSVN